MSYFTYSKERMFMALIATSMMFSGMAFIVNEMVLGALSSMLLSNSFVQFAMVVGVMMLGTGLGNHFQKIITDKLIIIKFIRLEMILTLVGAFAPITIYWMFANANEHFDFLLDASVFTLGFIIGFEASLLIRILERYRPNIKDNLALIFFFDYFGAFLGTVLWVYLLISLLPFTETSFLVSISNFLVAILTFLFFIKHKDYLQEIAYHKEKANLEKEIKVAKALDEDASDFEIRLKNLKKEDANVSYLKYGIIFSIVLGVLIFGFVKNKEWVMTSEQKMYKDPVILSATTEYQHIVVTDNKKTGEKRTYINGNIQSSSLDENIYHDHLIHPMMKLVSDRKGKEEINVLLIGAGDGMAARELQKYENVKISLVDLDRKMIELARTNPIMRELNSGSFDNVRFLETDAFSAGGTLNLVDDKNNTYDAVDVLNIDAEKFFRSLAKREWDAIIVDLPDPSSPELVKLYTKQFFFALKRVLTDDGLFVVQSTSPYHAKESYLCIGRTIEAAGLKTLPFHANVPSFGDWGFYIGWKNNDTKEDVKKQLITIEKFDVPTDHITPDVVRASLVFGKGWLETNDTRINEILHPILLDIYLNNSWLTY